MTSLIRVIDADNILYFTIHALLIAFHAHDDIENLAQYP